GSAANSIGRPTSHPSSSRRWRTRRAPMTTSRSWHWSGSATERASRLAPLATLVLLVPAAPASAAGPRLRDARPCPGTQGFTCSTLLVPLDHSGRAAGTLRLRVAAAANVDAPRGLLLFLAGGPGQPTVPILDRLADRMAPL